MNNIRTFINSKKRWNIILSIIFIVSIFGSAKADNGYRLWLKYDKIDNMAYLQSCRKTIKALNIAGQSVILRTAQEELHRGLEGLLASRLPVIHGGEIAAGSVIAGTPATVAILKSNKWQRSLAKLTKGGYIIQQVNIGGNPCILIASNEDIGVLYGVFHFLRLLQTQSDLKNIKVSSSPKLQWRILNHWDNLDGSVEQGFAGSSIWKWNNLPNKIDPRYKVYARANASIGINGVVLNSVNANPKIISKEYLVKVAALADVFRPYGIHVFLAVNFASPELLGKLNTSDPLNTGVKQWWTDKVDEIYKLIPDFGGFLIKVGYEGQPSPMDHHRTPLEGANMMAGILASHGGIMMWRVDTRKMSQDKDQAKLPYNNFTQFDGKFYSNVILQIKYGPLDFQPRIAFSPLLGAMPHTNEMVEFQITQEIDGSLQGQQLTGMTAVANVGDDTDWTGYIFGQANWYAFGRVAWDYELSAKEIANEWINMTLTHNGKAIKTILEIMMGSREVLVNYETPLGLNLLCDYTHYSPGPWVREKFTQVDHSGLGFDRTDKGSNAVAQYFPGARNIFANLHTCPENLLCYFHHVPWNYKMKSGRTFWEELCYKYYSGVKDVRQMQQEWNSLNGKIDPEIFTNTNELLKGQYEKAREWKEACLNYFKGFSGLPVPSQYQQFQ